MSGRALTIDELQDRFWGKVDKHGSGGCWIWKGALFSGRGYGCVSINRKVKKAHRVAWEWLRGPIPAGYQIDHLCYVRACVNPDHLEPVTPRENVRRSYVRRFGAEADRRPSRCFRGHRREPGIPYCRPCKNARDHVRRAKSGAGIRLSAEQERARLGRILTDYAGHGYASLEEAVADLWPVEEQAA